MSQEIQCYMHTTISLQFTIHGICMCLQETKGIVHLEDGQGLVASMYEWDTFKHWDMHFCNYALFKQSCIYVYMQNISFHFTVLATLGALFNNSYFLKMEIH